jgi:F420-0:gamma-glutamyl ligase-like protein
VECIKIDYLCKKKEGHMFAAFIIYNTSGFKLLEGKPDSEGSIDVSDLPKGLYVAVVYAKGKRHAEKFLHGESYN